MKLQQLQTMKVCSISEYGKIKKRKEEIQILICKFFFTFGQVQESSASELSIPCSLAMAINCESQESSFIEKTQSKEFCRSYSRVLTMPWKVGCQVALRRCERWKMKCCIGKRCRDYFLLRKLNWEKLHTLVIIWKRAGLHWEVVYNILRILKL